MASIYAVAPSGDVIRYDNVGYVLRGDAKTSLYTAADKKDWVADIPSAFAVSWKCPTAIGSSTDAAALKRALRNFDGRTGRWKGE